MDVSSAVPRTYCIIGDPITHSLSPGMQNAAFTALKLNYSYIALRVPPDQLKVTIESIRASNMAGFNVTTPHKISVIEYLDELDTSSKRVGAVNTVNNVQGRLVGYNTDIAGFAEPLKRRHISLDGLNVLLIGAGGAARAVVAALSAERLASLTIVNRTLSRASQLAQMGKDLRIPCFARSLEDARSIAISSDLIINASAMGLKNEKSILTDKDIRKGTIVYDIVYSPVITNLIENAKRSQAIIIYGYEMLVEQGAKAFEIWTGLPAPREAMKKNLLGVFGEPR